MGHGECFDFVFAFLSTSSKDFEFFALGVEIECLAKPASKEKLFFELCEYFFLYFIYEVINVVILLQSFFSL
jgi:hypothetical protein